MKQEKFNSLMVAIVAISAVFGFVSIVWASFSSTLTIQSAAKIEASKWDVHFGELGEVETKGTAAIFGSGPKLDESKQVISGFNVALKTPGDEVTFTVPVENHGTYDAKLTSASLARVTGYTSNLTDAAAAAADEEKVANSVTVTTTYEDGTEILSGDVLPKLNTLNEPGTKTIKITVKYRDTNNPEDLPSGDVNVAISDTVLVYGQA
jgi:hypothetical protein